MLIFMSDPVLSTADIDRKLDNCNSEIESIINNIENIIKELNEETYNEVRVASSGSGMSSLSNNKKLVKVNINGEIHYLVKTAIPVVTFHGHINKYKLTQTDHLNEPKYNSGCLPVAKGHCYSLYKGGKLSRHMEDYYTYKHFTDYFSTNLSDVLRKIYNQIIQGKPCVFQAQGGKPPYNRHYVTIVGLKGTVKDINNLKISDFDIIDAWNGKFMSLVSNKTANGQRMPFAQQEWVDKRTGKVANNSTPREYKVWSREKYYRVCILEG